MWARTLKVFPLCKQLFFQPDDDPQAYFHARVLNGVSVTED